MRCLKGNLISESPQCQRTVMNCCHVRGSLGRAKHTITTTAYSRHLALRTELSSSELRTQLFKFLMTSDLSLYYWRIAFKQGNTGIGLSVNTVMRNKYYWFNLSNFYS